MKLSELKRVARERTPGPWEAVECYVRGPNTMIMANGQDAKFIAAMANHIDALLRVVEAAERSIHNIDWFNNHESDLEAWKEK